MRKDWAVILAGGEGSRLESVTTALTGVPTPKQFCRLIGGTTLLEETVARLAGTHNGLQTLLVLSSRHQHLYEDLKRARPAGRLVEQPANRGTAVAMAFALGRILRTDPDPVVGFFPCDHHYANVSAFRQTVSAAYGMAANHPGHLVLVGAAPLGPEPDYGWIEAGQSLDETNGTSSHSLFAVERFWEKPDARLARRLFKRRCFWNTFMTIGTVGAFRAAFAHTAPSLTELMDTVTAAVTFRAEARAVADAYATLPTVCFSAGVLADVPDRCAVTPLLASGWIDIGHPERLAAVRSQGYEFDAPADAAAPASLGLAARP